MTVQAEVVVGNYRRFGHAHPLRFMIGPGFTAFVGPNNAGKSSVLRFIHEFRPLWAKLGEPNSGGIASVISGRVALGLNISDLVHVDNRSAPIVVTIGPLSDASGGLHSHPSRIRIQVMSDGTATADLELTPEAGFGKTEVLGKPAPHTLTTSRGELYLAPYVSLTADLRDAMFVGPFRNAVNLGGSGNYFDISIGAPFIRAWDEWISGNVPGVNDEAYAAVEEIRAAFGFDRFDVHANIDQTALNIRINDRTFKLNDVGSGLAEFIILLGNVRLKHPSYLLIDEPELHLHARLQPQLLHLLARHTRAGVLFASHSLGLAHNIADPIYLVRPVSDSESTVEPLAETRSLMELLGEMNYEGSRMLGDRTILFAEGPSDAAIWRELLKRFDGGRSVLVMHLGGSSAINGDPETQRMIADVCQLAGKVFAIVDSDRAAADAALSQNVSAFSQVCADTQLPCLVLQRPSVENYLHQRAISAEFGQAYRALGEYEKFSAVQPRWSKKDGWRVAARMSSDEIPNELSEFLRRVATA